MKLAAYHYAYDPTGNRVVASEALRNVSPPPTQFSAVEQGFMAIRLAWPDSSIEETGYRLERSTDNQQHW